MLNITNCFIENTDDDILFQTENLTLRNDSNP